MAAQADHVVVNEVHTDSVDGAGGTDDDWVELYNPTASDAILDGWSIQKSSASGATLVKEALSGTISAGSYFLIVRDGAAAEQSLKDSADLLASDAFSISDNNIVYLVGNSDDISSSADADIVDFVGFGSASYFEGASAAPNPPAEKSISRNPEGEDTDENSVDFVVLSSPTPQNSGTAGSNGVGGQVLLTITPDPGGARNITTDSADIVFQVNTGGLAYIYYGLNESYSSTSPAQAFTANSDATIALNNLQCGAEYHYAIYAENTGGTENDQTADAVFATLPCGIVVDSLTMAKSTAKANNDYADGWEWQFDITVWDLSETTLKMKFDAWSGAGALDAGGNMQFSIDQVDWHDIADNSVYPAGGVDISGLDESTDSGRQVRIFVRMKVPAGTLAGYYNSSYGILTE